MAPETLRFITCGGVDAGKSTLLERLLYETEAIHADELVALDAHSRGFGTQGNDVDFALRLDGLIAERQQGITIDVAYRYFSVGTRHFIVADAPGNEQYTRNMVTGASTADVAVVVVDAIDGVITQTKRHSYLLALLGIRQVVLAINKLDKVGYRKAVSDRITADYCNFARQIGLTGIVCIPLSAFRGDNITALSKNTDWYSGPTLMNSLTSAQPKNEMVAKPFRMPIQRVSRPTVAFRGYSGRIVGGSIRPGDRVRVLPSGTDSTVNRIVTQPRDLEEAFCGQSVTLTLQDEIAITRGDMLVATDAPAGVADQFEATLIWMSETEMLPGRQYSLKSGARTVCVTVATPKFRININTLEHVAAKTMRLNEIAVCNINLDQPIAFDRYVDNRDTGSFILIDRFSNETVGAGLLHFALRRSQNLHWQAIEVDKQAHAQLNGQRPCIVWFTGLSGAGKSTIANVLERKLHALGRHTYLLDGDNVRHGLNRDLGFTTADRVENIRRVAEVAKLMVDAGLIVLVSFISPFNAERQMARRLVQANEFCEVFVNAPLEVAERRDPKGLYKKARLGQLVNFTGIDSPYEEPTHPDLNLDTTTTAAEDAAELVLMKLRALGVLT